MVSATIDSLEDDPEIALTKKRIHAMDWEMQLVLRRLILVGLTIGVCVYCVFSCGYCLLIIMVVSACFCQWSPLLLFPFTCSLVFYIGSHIPTLEQIFTISADIYEFHEKYK
jgi:hypothetical protein